MKFYVTRDKDRRLFLWPEVKPTKGMNSWYILGQIVKVIQLNSDELPSVKWEDPEPTEVELVMNKKV